MMRLPDLLLYAAFDCLARHPFIAITVSVLFAAAVEGVAGI